MASIFFKSTTRILVTGGGGFIGGALIRKLISNTKCSIFNLDLKLLLSCNRSFADYLEDRLIDAVNY